MTNILEKTRAILAAVGLMVAFAGACSSETNEGTNTNWAECDGDADCRDGGAHLTCVARRCVASGPEGGRDAEPGAGGRVNVPEGSPVDTCVARAPIPEDTWTIASQDLPACRLSDIGPGTVQLRCGALDAVRETGIDSWWTHYYDAEGRLVGRTDGGLTSGPPCTSYSDTFTEAPSDCVTVTPPCDDAGLVGSCVAAPPRPEDTWETSGTGFAECAAPGNGDKVQYRCGELDAIQEGDRGTWTRRYYDAAGRLVGETTQGVLTWPVCRSFSATFPERLAGCVLVTPPCEAGAPDDGGGGDAGTPGDAAVSECPLVPVPTGPDPACRARFEDALTLVPSCYEPPFPPFQRARCGPYDAVISLAFDASHVCFYSSAGDVVGETTSFFSDTECRAFDSGFTEAPTCTPSPPPVCP